MGKLQKLFGIGALTLALSGCGEEEKLNPVYLEGKVIKENYQLDLKKPKYVLTVDTNEGVYTFEVVQPTLNLHYRTKPIAALEEAIQTGDKIKFKVGVNSTKKGYITFFSKDKIGEVISHEVEIIGKAKK